MYHSYSQSLYCSLWSLGMPGVIFQHLEKIDSFIVTNDLISNLLLSCVAKFEHIHEGLGGRPPNTFERKPQDV